MPRANKFRGCLLGAVLGDCLGSPFEYIADATVDELNKFFHAIDLGQPSMRSSYPYTDDTAMILCIAESFISKGTFDVKDVAKRFVDEYYSSISIQGEYGCHVRSVFAKLRSQNFEELFKPASEQFNGTGSYGNGGAMRVAPVALFCHKDFKHMLHVAEQITQITHTHSLGINGALLQCIAVHQALTLDPAEGPLDVNDFLDTLILKMQDIEKSNAKERPYHDKLQKIKRLLSKDNVDIEMVKEALGNNISAHGSVPIAIYSFLRAQKPIPKIEANNKFRRTIQYAIFCGGDTDTIACMAGAIAGAYYGEDEIEKSLRQFCGGVKRALELADKLSELDSLK